MVIREMDQQPHRTRTMDETKRAFATRNDARWRGIKPRRKYIPRFTVSAKHAFMR